MTATKKYRVKVRVVSWKGADDNRDVSAIVFSTNSHDAKQQAVAEVKSYNSDARSVVAIGHTIVR